MTTTHQATDRVISVLKDLAALVGHAGGAVASCSINGTHHHVEHNNDGFALVSRDSMFDLGSVAKVVTAGVLLNAHSARQIDRRSRVSECSGLADLPSFWDEVTLDDLATHRAGLPKLPPNLTGPLWDPYRDWNEPELHHAMQRMPGATLVERPSYSNFGYAVLARCLSYTLGAPMPELVTRYVARPFELKSLTAAPTPDERVIDGYESSGQAALPWPFHSMLGAGGVYGTVTDLLALGRTTARFTDLEQPPSTTNAHTRFGHGWMVTALPKAQVIWSHGETSVSTAFLAVHRQWDVTLILLVNRGGVANVLPMAFRALSQLVEIRRWNRPF